MAQITVRMLRREDYPQVLRIFRQLHKIHSDLRPDYYYASDIPITEERYVMLLEEGMQILGAMDGETLAGMCFYQWMPNNSNSLVKPRKTILLDDICVDVAYRRQGVGEMLCRKAIEIAKAENADAVELGVWAENLPAVALYRKMGFAPRTMRMELRLDR